MDDDVMGEPDVIRLLGRERFERLRRGGWLTTYTRHYVLFRLREDKALHPEGTRPAVVTKGYTRPAPPPASDYSALWTEEAVKTLLGRDAFAKAVRSWSLRPVAVRGGVMLFDRRDVRPHLPRVLPPAVQREYAALRRAMRAAGLGG
jgi:hypothetical protein